MSKIGLVLVLFVTILTSAVAETPVSLDDIRESVFRYQMDRWKASTYYLSVGIDKQGRFTPPPTGFMHRFMGQDNVKGSILIQSPPDEKSIILCIDHVRTREKSAEVNARFIPYDLTKSFAGFYSLVLQKNGQWKVTKTSRFKVIPVERD